MDSKERAWTKRVIAHVDKMTDGVLGDELVSGIEIEQVAQAYRDGAPPKAVADVILSEFRAFSF